MTLKDIRDKTPNILNSNFENSESNNTICTDVTFIKWKDKFIYLSSVIDLRNNKIVGWSLSERNDLNLVMETFKSINLKKYKIINSNHWYQYASNQFKKILKDNSVTQSMSHVGNSLHNHPIECWFSIIKENYIKLLFLNNMTFENIHQKIKHFIKY